MHISICQDERPVWCKLSGGNTVYKLVLFVHLNFCPTQSKWWKSTKTDSVWSAFSPTLSFVFASLTVTSPMLVDYLLTVHFSLNRSVQIVHIDKQTKMLDSPSIIADPSNSALALALRSIIDTEESGSADVLEAVDTILNHCSKQQVSSLFPHLSLHPVS